MALGKRSQMQICDWHQAATAHVRLIVWCLDCPHQVKPDLGEMAERYGGETTIPDWRTRLVSGECGSRRVVWS
jgi:hypothetical protein